MRTMGDGYFEFRRGEAFTRFQRADAPIDSAETIELALDKAEDYRRLRDAGVPVPEHLEFNFRDPSLAIAFLEGADGPCVIKPAAGTGAGSGVTSGVRTREHLVRAALRASRNADRLLIERQADGHDYRALVLDGELLDLVRRGRPCVIGDGRSTVGQLIAAENRRRLAGDGLERLRMLRVDLDAVLALERQGLKVRSTVPTGDRIAVKRVVNQNAAGENETIHEPPSGELHALLLRAARASGLRLAGVDLVADDLADPLGAGGVILEVNPNPGIHHHYAVADRRRATRVAVPILRTLLGEPAGSNAKKGQSR